MAVMEIKSAARTTADRDKAPTTPTTRKLTDKQTLDRAVATMDTIYGVISAGLLMFQLPQTAETWASQLDKLAENNREALAASPKLAESLAKGGDGLGGAAFIVGHVMAIAPVVRAARDELEAKRVARAQSEPDGAWVPDADAAAQPGAVPFTG
jgi:hypothetical protein